MNDLTHRLRNLARPSWSREPSMKSSALNHAVSTLGLRRGQDELSEKNCQGTNGQVKVTVEERQ